MENFKNFKSITENEKYQECKNCRQHGDFSVYDHSVYVANICVTLSNKLHMKVDKESLVKVALLHDYFQYDWHDKNHPKLHGFRHAGFAANNAKRDFGLTKKEERAIRAHMFPLGYRLPSSREAFLLTIADKYCATRETVHGISKKVKNGTKKVISAPKRFALRIKH